MKAIVLSALLIPSALISSAYASEPIFLVDDDNGKRYEEKYKVWCHEAGIPATYWETQSMGTPSLEQMVKYRTVFWFTGNSGSLSNEEEARLKEYLDNSDGRRSLLLTGDGLARSLRHGFNDHQQFLGWYLNAHYIKTEGDPDIGVNEQCDVFRWAYLPAIFSNYSSDDYHFKLWNMADIIKPNDGSHRMVMLSNRNATEGMKNTLECVAVSNRKHFKTVFVTFDLAHEDSRYINESSFIRTCVEWLQQ